MQQIPSATTQSSSEDAKHPVSQISMSAITLPVTTETTYSSDNNEIFRYTYQSIALTLPDPDVAEQIIIDFLDNIDATRATADTIKAAAEANYQSNSNKTPYLCQILFEPMRIDQNVLSLFGNFVSYQDMPHPESTQSSLTYDFITGKKLALGDILVDHSAVSDAITALMLEVLSNRTDLYPDYADIVRERMSANFMQDTSWYLSTKGLCLYFAPYDIAPYSAGIIHVEIPYKNLAGILDDAYFPAELELADGSLSVSAFTKQSIGQFTQICEVTVGNSNQACLLFTDRSVHNLMILSSSNAQSYVEQTIFLSHTLTPGDAVVIQGFDPQEHNVIVIYEANNEQISSTLHFDPATQSYMLQPRA